MNSHRDKAVGHFDRVMVSRAAQISADA